jgi:hypothetical protein
MKTRTRISTLATLSMAAAALAAWSVSVSAGQKPADAGSSDAVVKAFIASHMAKGWTPTKTPWGDPLIEGVFTNKDENNTPFERPAEWAGRKMEDITPQEFAAAVAKRQEEAVENAPVVGGGDAVTGVSIAEPIHWFENLDAKNSRPWFVIEPADGMLPPITAEAKARPRPSAGPRLAQSYTDIYMWTRCLSRGAPAATMMPIQYGNSYQILQTPDYVVIRYEMINERRIIPIERRWNPNQKDRPPIASPKINGYFGYSRGHWEGNSFVVESSNYEPMVTYRAAAGTVGVKAGSTNEVTVPARQVHFTERFTRISPKQVEWTVTVDDPSTWVRPFTYSLPLTEDNGAMPLEYACSEGNYGIQNILTAARELEKKGQTRPAR